MLPYKLLPPYCAIKNAIHQPSWWQMSSSNSFKMLPYKLLPPYSAIKNALHQPSWWQVSSSNSFKMLPYELLPSYSAIKKALHQPSWWQMSSSNSFRMLPYKLLPPYSATKHIKSWMCHNTMNNNRWKISKWRPSFSDRFSISGSVWTLRILPARRGDPTADPQDVPIEKLWNHPSAWFFPKLSKCNRGRRGDPYSKTQLQRLKQIENFSLQAGTPFPISSNAPI